MTKTIKIDDKQAESLAFALEKDNEKKRNKIKELSLQIEDNNRLISSLRSNSVEKVTQKEKLFNDNELTGNGYNPEWSNIEKTEFFLKNTGRFLKIGDLANFLFKYEPHIKETKRYRDVTTTFSATLASYCKKEKRINRFKDENDQFKYGLIQWFNENGEPKDDYK